MKTPVRLANTLKVMMEDTALEQISVKALTEEVSINRQTFYYYFRNVYDLLAEIYLNEKIPNLNEAKTWEQVLTAIFAYTDNNLAFIRNTLSSIGRDLFKEFIYSALYRSHLRLLNEHKHADKLSHDDKKFIASLYAPMFANIIVQYAEGVIKTPPLQLIEQLKVLLGNYLREAVDNIINYRNKKGVTNERL